MIGLISAKRVFKYAVMPDVISRINALTMSGFQNIAYLVAIVYNMVRLLPDNHPYLDGRNIGRFGIRHVIAEAASNLVFSRKNIDQIILFFALLIGMIMLALQISLLIISVFMMSAMAGAPPPPSNWNHFFVVASPSQDIAYMLLDLVFGIPHPTAFPGKSFFESCVGSAAACLNTAMLPITDPDLGAFPAMPVGASFTPIMLSDVVMPFPYPIHLGMQALFGMYNMGIMIVAIMVTAYFIATVLAETAQSGTPFGKRFNKMWAPIRIVVAFGLLIPLFGNFSGFNSGQYIVLYAAKYGSAFATNGWERFNQTLTTNYLNGAANLAISTPNTPDMTDLSMFMWLVNVCYYVNFYQNNLVVKPYVVAAQQKAPNTMLMGDGTSYDDVLNFLDPLPQMIVIRFGEKNEGKYPKEDGFVKPICGEIQIPLTDARRPANLPPPSPGPYAMQYFYYTLIRDMFWENIGLLSPYPLAAVVDGGGGFSRADAFAHWGVVNKFGAVHNSPLRTVYTASVNSYMNLWLKAVIAGAALAQGGGALAIDVNGFIINVSAETSWVAGPCATGALSTLNGRGWAAAGIWYNCLAELNGNYTSAVFATPNVTKYPEVMERVASIKGQYNQKSLGAEIYEPTVAGVNDVCTLLNAGSDCVSAKILYNAYKQWAAGSIVTTQTKASNPVTQAISMFLGTNGLYDMRANTNVHPLAQLVGIGRALVEAAIRKLGYALVGSVVARGLGGADGGIVGMASSMLVTVAMIGLTAGFILFYVVPFLPFIYFFFAVGGWVKGIFEAMVGVPLWALAHIRIDGHGLPGNAALNGYFLIFEIFLRPILTLFGLLASVSIFASLVLALNTIWDLVVYNVSGFDAEQEITGGAADSVMSSMRGTIDEFFFTIIYAVVVYMMAMSSFKLIDQIPNNILRWMGQSVATFGDTREDPAQGLMGKVSMGAQQTFSKLGSGMTGIVGAIAGKK